MFQIHLHCKQSSHRNWRVWFILGVFAFSPISHPLWGAELPTRAREAEPSPTHAALTDDEITRIARKAYVWGWPLVYLRNFKTALERLPSPGRSGGMPVAPPNQLCMLTDFISPQATTVPCPNRDVVYGFGMFDLSHEPVVLQVPDFGDRFWLYQLGDQRTDGFANVGKMYGTKPGFYLVVGPDWQGTTDTSFAGVLRSPTRLGYCLPRIFLDDSEVDRQAVAPVLGQIMAYPLSRFNGRMKSYDWEKVRWYPRIAAGNRDRSRWVVPDRFFDSLAEVLDDVPPLPGENRMYEQFRQLLQMANDNPAVRQKLDETAAAAEADLVAPLFEFRNFGTTLPHHWTTITNGASFGTDYRTRTAVARSNAFVNRHHETKYYYQDRDAEGKLLRGRTAYRVTIEPERLPAGEGFWSLTLYDDKHSFHPNAIGRYSLGTKSKSLRYNEDGSLTIWIQPDPPKDDHDYANWLPSPLGAFSLYLRAYSPDAELLAGAWVPPPVVSVGQQPESVTQVSREAY